MDQIELTEDNVLEFITQRRHVTFAELGRYFKDFDGDRAFGQLDNNVFFWGGMSQEICVILKALERAGKIYTRQTPVIVYLADGVWLRLPVAKRLNFKYKKPRWLPVVFNPVAELVNETAKFQKDYAAYMRDVSENG